MNSPFKGKYGPLLIAEIGGNHEGNFEYAKKLTGQAIATGVDFVKFQIYSGDTLVSSMESPDRNKHFKKFELTREQHLYLAHMVREAGIQYMSSVWDVEVMEWIDPFMPVYKVGSGDLTAYPVLKQIVKKDKPIILSTGLSTEKEVLETIGYIQRLNPHYQSREMLAILQCTSMYPIEASDSHLQVMQTFRDLTGLTVGYSDHTVGSKALYYAVAMGAEILEFHFTDSREGKSFRDHKVSLVPSEVTELIEEIKLINAYRGDSTKKPLVIELENGHEKSFRRAVYPKLDLPSGTILTEDNLTVLRPNHGIDAREFEKVLGKTLLKDVRRHQKLTWDMIN
jgi:N-acetylneuraminate synthase/N,N'-diacetyllegionaminate synthase